MAEEVANGPWIVDAHVMTKTWQLGCILSTAIGSALTMRRSGVAGLKGIKYGPGLQTLPIVLGGLGYPLSEFAMKKRPGPTGEVDRAFRIMHNRLQNRFDQFSYHGAIVGVALGVLKIGAGALLPGIWLGSTLGIAACKFEEFILPDLHKGGTDYPPWKH